MRSALASALVALAVLTVAPGSALAGQEYVTMADGTELAVWVQLPRDYDGESKLPAIFEYDGYNGGGNPSYFGQFIDTSGYAVVHAGVRGAGCSDGAFSLFSEQQARDGAFLVDWIAKQDWSNGDVGIYGHSYSATMGLLVAAQRPEPLRAVTVDGVLHDLYRDLVYPGGVSNSGFPILWLAAARPAQEHQGGTQPSTERGDYRCLEHVLRREPVSQVAGGSAQESPYLQGLAGMEDNAWWRSVSPSSVIDRIEVPVQITGNLQDDQTLARGPAAMWEALSEQRSQLLLTNGDHNSFWLNRDRDLLSRREAWLDHYVRGEENGIEDEPRVQFFLEGHRGEGGIRHTGAVKGDDFPLPSTEWRRFHAGEGKTLVEDAPASAGSDMFVSGTRRNVYDPGAVNSPNPTYPGQELATADGPDQLTYRSEPFDEPTTVAGPVVASLWASLVGGDADLYVRVADEAPDGSLSLLNRGFLKASHRAVDESRSWFDGDVMYRPWHPHTNTTTALLTPGEGTRLDVEIWPLSHVFRPGHRLVMIVSSPPLQEGYDTYQPRTAPGPVTILRGPETPSHLLVPVVPTPADLGPAVPCGAQVAVKCAKPAELPAP
jgi:putative CocE/NonD family hydrolase